MEFGYFTLSDNHYDNNVRGANQLVRDITAEALYADELGMNSVWIGEHHFNSLGVLSCPDLVLASIAARTSRVRLAPAVTVSPLHNPIRIAEQWATLDLLSDGRVDFAAGRGYDSREYLPFHVDFADNQSIFEEGIEVVQKLWEAEEPISHHGKHYDFDDVRITPRPIQQPSADLHRFVLPAVDRAGRPARLRTRRCAVRRVDELRRPVAGRRPLHRDVRKARAQASAAHVQLLHPLLRQPSGGGGPTSTADPLLQGVRDPRVPGDPATAPPSYRYFVDMVTRLQNVTAEQLTENSVLLGTPESITDTLKKVEAAGFSEVILYFNVGLKPHNQVMEEMDRFMREVAPNFDGAHTRRPAA